MKRFFSLVCGLLLCWNGLNAQEIDVDIQIRPRYEYRSGYKSLRSATDDPASFISQRSRMGLNYASENLDFRVSLQHSGTWGADAGNMGLVGVFEAYGRYRFNDAVAIKAGRQVLSYDNERIFGEQSWTLTGRSHDALIIDISPGDRHTIHGGLALNANRETLTKEAYSGDYRTMQYLWYHYQVDKFGLSLLLANVGYEQETVVNRLKLATQQTVGGYLKWSDGRFSADGSFYRQAGKRGSDKLEAYYAGANFTYRFSFMWAAATGFEYLSGNDQADIGEVNRAFMPVFGTNHAFNGHMDYFYVGNHQNSVGLKDFYMKGSFDRGPFSAHISPHIFYAAADMPGEEQTPTNNYLGTEIDLSTVYRIDSQITLSAGYSRMFGSPSLEILKGGDRSLGQHWSWLSLSFAPKFKVK